MIGRLARFEIDIWGLVGFPRPYQLYRRMQMASFGPSSIFRGVVSPFSWGTWPPSILGPVWMHQFLICSDQNLHCRWSRASLRGAKTTRSWSHYQKASTELISKVAADQCWLMINASHMCCSLTHQRAAQCPPCRRLALSGGVMWACQESDQVRHTCGFSARFDPFHPQTTEGDRPGPDRGSRGHWILPRSEGAARADW